MAELSRYLPPPPPPPPRAQLAVQQPGTLHQDGAHAGPAATANSQQQPRTPTPPSPAPIPPPFPPPKGSDWTVRRVVQHRQAPDGKHYYWVEWGDSWVPQEHIEEETLSEYWQLRGESPPAPHAAERKHARRKAAANPRQEQKQPPPSEQRAGHSSPRELE
jgi:hypothetical protein